jgi:hypothetical protein
MHHASTVEATERSDAATASRNAPSYRDQYITGDPCRR